MMSSALEDFRRRQFAETPAVQAVWGGDSAGGASAAADAADVGQPDASRVVVHIDVDAFYAQVEELRNPALREQPLAVTQKYIVVTSNYPARARGVTKLMAITDARARCPELVCVCGEDLTPYRRLRRAA